MSTHTRLPSRLPDSAIPDGCLPWNGEQTRRWTEAFAPWWVPVRGRGRYVETVGPALPLAAVVLSVEGVPPCVAALLALQVLWLMVRPEVVRYSAPAQVVMVAGLQPTPSWPLIGCGVLFAGALVRTAELRLRSRTRQRKSALSAAGGVTAPLPDAGAPLRRGRLLAVLGSALSLAGGVLVATHGTWGDADDRRAAAGLGCFVAGLGVTVLLSAALGRHRAARLRAAPAPVLRVLVREDPHGDAEVFAADDVLAMRPLFTVAVSEFDADEEESDEDDEDDENDEDDDGDEDAGLDDFLDRLADDEPGPLREAVLYGVPYDGAEVLIVSAGEAPDEPLVVEWSTGPVRPLPDRAAARRRGAGKRAAAREAQQREQALRDVRAVGAVGPAEAGTTSVPVRSWRAGWPDWLAGALLAQWGVWLSWAAFTDAESAVWLQLVVVAVGLAGAARLAVKLRWRITADRTGLWINGLLRPTHIPWDDLRSVRRESVELKLRWRGGESWSVVAPRWGRLQRRWGLTHPYDALVAELTALHADPALRPTGESGERQRGRPLWPLAVVFAGVWVAAVVVARWLL